MDQPQVISRDGQVVLDLVTVEEDDPATGGKVRRQIVQMTGPSDGVKCLHVLHSGLGLALKRLEQPAQKERARIIPARFGRG